MKAAEFQPDSKTALMHSATAGRLTFPDLRIVNPLERFVGTEDQAGDKPTHMFKSFRSAKKPPKAFQPLGNNRWHTGDR
jgi:hypothetical protein